MSQKIGYARISTPDQKLDLQIDALQKEGCEKIFTDTMSGARDDRPGFDEMVNYIRPGDTLVVWKLDRLGRTMKLLINFIEYLEKNKIEFKSVNEGINTNTTIGRFTFNIFSSLAQFERDMIRERSIAGQAAARARGDRTGRPKKLDKKKRKLAVDLYKAEKYKITEICQMLEITKPTLYKYIRE